MDFVYRYQSSSKSTSEVRSTRDDRGRQESEHTRYRAIYSRQQQQQQRSFNFLQVSPVFFPPLAQFSQGSPGVRREHAAQVYVPQTSEVKELLHIYERLGAFEFKSTVLRTLPLVATQAENSEVFLNLQKLETLSPDFDDDTTMDSDASWSSNPSDGTSRASDTLINNFYRLLGNKTSISTLAILLGLKLTQSYCQCLNEITQCWEHQGSNHTPTSFISSNSYSSTSIHPTEIIKSKYHLILVGVMLANKYTEDKPHSSISWANMVGFSGDFLNRLENCFLRTIGHRMYVDEQEFKEWILTLSRLLNWVPPSQRMLWTASSAPKPRMPERTTLLSTGGWWPTSRFTKYVQSNLREDDSHRNSSTLEGKGKRPPGI